MGQWGRLAYAQKKCVSTTGYVMQSTDMVHPGARIGVAVSGGVDSFVMLQTLMIRQAIMPFDVELMVLHVNPGFSPESHAPLARWCAERGLAAHLELSDYGPRAHSDENLKNSPCFFCCRLRRKRLFELCRTYGLTHLAFGHNADDLVDTFFMNILQTARVEGLSIAEPFFGGRLKVIRPLALIHKSTIRTAARQWELPVWANDCPSDGATKRTEIHDWIATAWQHDPKVKNNVFNAVCRLQMDLTISKV